MAALGHGSLGGFEDRTPCQFEPKLIKRKVSLCHGNNNIYNKV